MATTTTYGIVGTTGVNLLDNTGATNGNSVNPGPSNYLKMTGCQFAAPAHGEVDISFKGSAISFPVLGYNQGNGSTIPIVNVSVNGAAGTDYSFALTTWNWVNITGLVDDGVTANTIKIKVAASFPKGNTAAFWGLSADSSGSYPGFQVSGNSPSTVYGSLSGPQIALGSNPSNMAVGLGYTVGTISEGSYGAYNNGYQDTGISFNASAPSIGVYLYSAVNANCVINLQCDGASVGKAAVTGGGGGQLFTFSSLDSSRMHTYRVSQASGGYGDTDNSAATIVFCNVIAIGGTMGAAAMPTPKRIVGVGTSIMHGSHGLTPVTSTTGPLNLLHGWYYQKGILADPINLGYNSADVVAGIGGNSGSSVASIVAGFSPKADIVLSDWGTNAAYNNGGTAISISTFTSTMTTTLESLLSSLNSGGKIVCKGVIPRTGQGLSKATCDSFSAAVFNSVNAANANNSTNAASYIYDYNIYTSASFQADSVHLNSTVGQPQMAASYEEGLSPTAKTLYWNNAYSQDALWQTLINNWWSDSAYSNQSIRLPAAVDSVVVASHPAPANGPSGSLALTGYNLSTTALNALGDMSFSGQISIANGGILSINGPISFNGSIGTGCTVNINGGTFNGNSSSGIAFGDFGNNVDISTLSSSGIVTGNCTFSGRSASYGTIVGNAAFSGVVSSGVTYGAQWRAGTISGVFTTDGASGAATIKASSSNPGAASYAGSTGGGGIGQTKNINNAILI